MVSYWECLEVIMRIPRNWFQARPARLRCFLNEGFHSKTPAAQLMNLYDFCFIRLRDAAGQALPEINKIGRSLIWKEKLFFSVIDFSTQPVLFQVIPLRRLSEEKITVHQNSLFSERQVSLNRPDSMNAVSRRGMTWNKTRLGQTEPKLVP